MDIILWLLMLAGPFAIVSLSALFCGLTTLALLRREKAGCATAASFVWIIACSVFSLVYDWILPVFPTMEDHSSIASYAIHASCAAAFIGMVSIAAGKE